MADTESRWTTFADNMIEFSVTPLEILPRWYWGAAALASYATWLAHYNTLLVAPWYLSLAPLYAPLLPVLAMVAAVIAIVIVLCVIIGVLFIVKAIAIAIQMILRYIYNSIKRGFTAVGNRVKAAWNGTIGALYSRIA